MYRQLIVISAALFATAAIADELDDIVFHAGAGVHVYETSQPDNNAPHFHVSPLFPAKIRTLGEGRIFSLKPAIERHGIDLKPGELVLYSPNSQLLFCRGFNDTRDLVQTLFELCNHDSTAYQFTLWAAASKPASTKRVVMRGRSVSGGLFEVAAREGQKLALEFVVGPSGRTTDVTVKGHLQFGDDFIEISTRCTGEMGKDIVLFERSGDEESKRIDRLVLQIEALPSEHQLYHDEDWQKARANEIAAELTKKAGTDSKSNLNGAK